MCVCVCVFSLDKMLLQGLRINRFSCIPTPRSFSFVFGNDNFCFRFRGMVYQYEDRGKKKGFLVSASLQGEGCDQQEPFTDSRLFWRIEEWRRRFLSVVMMMWGTRNLGFQTLACLRDGKVFLLLFLFFGRLHWGVSVCFSPFLAGLPWGSSVFFLLFLGPSMRHCCSTWCW